MFDVPRTEEPTLTGSSGSRGNRDRRALRGLVGLFLLGVGADGGQSQEQGDAGSSHLNDSIQYDDSDAIRLPPMGFRGRGTGYGVLGARSKHSRSNLGALDPAIRNLNSLPCRQASRRCWPSWLRCSARRRRVPTWRARPTPPPTSAGRPRPRSAPSTFSVWYRGSG